MNYRRPLGLLAATGLLAVSLVGCSPGGQTSNTSVNTTGTGTTGPPPGDSPVAATTGTGGTPSETVTPGPGGTGTPGETGTPGAGTPGAGGADDGFEKAASMPGYDDVKKLKVPAGGPDSVTKGQALFSQYCASCHGESMTGDGPAAAAITTGPPRNLLEKDSYKYGHGIKSIFRTDKYGIPATGMAAVAASDEELFHIAYYIQSKQK